MIIISPSKKLDLNQETVSFVPTEPKYSKQSKKISDKIKDLDFKSVKSLMGISQNLARLNYNRFKSINTKSNVKKSAAFIFSGDTFNGLSFRTLDEGSLLYAQKKLRILSGLYGILKPFDNIEPYRLEMGTNTKNLIGEDLYNFWGESITLNIKNDINKNKSEFLYNLASNEYSKVVNLSSLNCKTISFDFKKRVNNKFTGIGMMIKKMRGCMAKFIIENKIEDLESLKNFRENGFTFSHLDNESMKFVFTS